MHTNLIVAQRTTEDLATLLEQGEDCFRVAHNYGTLSFPVVPEEEEQRLVAKYVSI